MPGKNGLMIGWMTGRFGQELSLYSYVAVRITRRHVNLTTISLFMLACLTRFTVKTQLATHLTRLL